MTELLYATNTAGTPTTPTTSDVAILTGNVKPNQYNAVKVSAHVEVTTTGTSGTNTCSVKLKIGGATGTTLKTYSFKTDAVARIIPFTLEWVGDLSQGGALVVTISVATAPDANTTFVARSLYVHSIA